MKYSVDCIIVTYNPGENFLENLRNVKKAVRKIYIIDNNSSDLTKLKIIEEEFSKDEIELIFNKENIGLAEGQNIGIEKSMENNSEWILILDDDSEIDQKMIPIMLDYYSKCCEKDKIAILAPQILYKENTKKTAYPIETKIGIKRKYFLGQNSIENVVFVIASGSLIKTSIIKKIGKMKSNFFIDHIDVEYCLRIKNLGFKIVALKEAKLFQRVGNTVEKSIFGIKVYPTNHNPKRQYTKFRNACWTWKEYFFKETKYIIYDIMLMTNHMIRVLAFEDKKYENLKYILKGLKDGLLESGKKKN